jgi:hypothetical protein
MKAPLLLCVLAAHVVATAAVAGEPADDPTITAPLGNAISYQGKLDKNGVPVNGNYNFTFGLYDALSGGTQIGVTLNVTNQPVSAGLFSVALDFGPGAFTGNARWLLIQVQGPGEGGFTTLAPRQSITAAPYALHALSAPGSGSQWTNSNGDLTYAGGGVGVLNGSSPFAAGKGVFIEGGSTTAGQLFAFDYDTVQPLNLLLNSPGGKVGVGVSNPDGKLQANSSNEAAIVGKHTGNWVGVYGESQNHAGVWGNSVNGIAVVGTSTNTWGVSGKNTTSLCEGLLGTGGDGVAGFAHNAAHIGGRFENTAGGTALWANGLAKVKTLQILGGADIVEGFETGDDVLEPGTVVVIDERHPGELRASARAYDSRVAGVVSGAGGIAPGLRLGQERVMDGETSVAMTGRAYVRCSVQNGRIRPGDLLTTSDHAGHAMRASDAERSNGAVLGKAMTSLGAGTGSFSSS